ncbi:hypothetical protein B0I37DRAFT_349231 [Chaetomium sp. MPI-CAGE-AT-0009]|nr:hypothetical protein B0I37DRAFT_349231 [Chaetomium sp. MPI-CAGE-AT-0009]
MPVTGARAHAGKLLGLLLFLSRRASFVESSFTMGRSRNDEGFWRRKPVGDMGQAWFNGPDWEGYGVPKVLQTAGDRGYSDLDCPQRKPQLSHDSSDSYLEMLRENNPYSHLQLRRAIGWGAAGSQGQFRRIGQFKSAAQATASTAKLWLGGKRKQPSNPVTHLPPVPPIIGADFDGVRIA